MNATGIWERAAGSRCRPCKRSGCLRPREPFFREEMNTKAKLAKENPLQDPKNSPELTCVPITKAALWGAGWVLRRFLGPWECLRLCG